MIDSIRYVLSAVGPAWVSLWTWTIADYEVDAVGGLLAQGGILGARLIIDYSAGRRLPGMVNEWRDRYGEDSVRIVRNHAKIARVWNSDFRVLLRGSMNLNFNPRFENLDVTEGGEDFELVREIEDRIPVLPREYGHQEVFDASGLGRAFDLKTLEAFQGVRPWRP